MFFVKLSRRNGIFNLRNVDKYFLLLVLIDLKYYTISGFKIGLNLFAEVATLSEGMKQTSNALQSCHLMVPADTHSLLLL